MGLLVHCSQPSLSAITENEKLLLRSKNYAAIISSQKTFDDQIDRQVTKYAHHDFYGLIPMLFCY